MTSTSTNDTCPLKTHFSSPVLGSLLGVSGDGRIDGFFMGGGTTIECNLEEVEDCLLSSCDFTSSASLLLLINLGFTGVCGLEL